MSLARQRNHVRKGKHHVRFITTKRPRRNLRQMQRLGPLLMGRVRQRQTNAQRHVLLVSRHGQARPSPNQAQRDVQPPQDRKDLRERCVKHTRKRPSGRFGVRFCTTTHDQPQEDNMQQSKQSHTPTTPAHVEDDPCDDWIAIGSAAQRIIDDYAPDDHRG